MSFAVFWKRNLGFFNLAVVSNLEYRVNYIIDALVQPIITCGIELTLWYAIFKTSDSGTIGGFTREYYLSYALWASFAARISTSWMYEFRMIEEVESGTINSLLVRPMSFYEYYLSQLMGYKFITTFVSFLFPVSIVLTFGLPTDFSKLPIALLLMFYYLFLVHSISFLVSTAAFFLNKIHSFTMAKNLLIWLLTGELVPIDLMPVWLRDFMMILPFPSAVFIPVGYITGRIDSSLVVQGFVSVTASIVAVNALGYFFWRKGLKNYVGTGA
jgi:ABC-2 type transport system permease protein